MTLTKAEIIILMDILEEKLLAVNSQSDKERIRSVLHKLGVEYLTYDS